MCIVKRDEEEPPAGAPLDDFVVVVKTRVWRAHGRFFGPLRGLVLRGADPAFDGGDASEAAAEHVLCTLEYAQQLHGELEQFRMVRYEHAFATYVSDTDLACVLEQHPRLCAPGLYAVGALPVDRLHGTLATMAERGFGRHVSITVSRYLLTGDGRRALCRMLCERDAVHVLDAGTLSPDEQRALAHDLQHRHPGLREFHVDVRRVHVEDKAAVVHALALPVVARHAPTLHTLALPVLTDPLREHLVASSDLLHTLCVDVGAVNSPAYPLDKVLSPALRRVDADIAVHTPDEAARVLDMLEGGADVALRADRALVDAVAARGDAGLWHAFLRACADVCEPDPPHRVRLHMCMRPARLWTAFVDACAATVPVVVEQPAFAALRAGTVQCRERAFGDLRVHFLGTRAAFDEWARVVLPLARAGVEVHAPRARPDPPDGWTVHGTDRQQQEQWVRRVD